jgi:hypothetical protein
VSDIAPSGTVSIGTLRQWKSSLELLGGEGNLELLRLVADQRERREHGDATSALTPEQVAEVELLTGIKAEYEEPPIGAAGQ